MDVIIGALIFSFFLALVAGEVFTIKFFIKKSRNLNVFMKLIVGMMALLVVNAPYMYVAEVRPQENNPILLFGMVEAFCLAFYGFYHLSQDYLSLFRRKRAEANKSIN